MLERICRDVAGSGYAVVEATSVAAGDDRIEALLPELCDRLNSGDNDYESYISSDGTPSILTHYGFWTEGVRVDALRRV